VRAVSAPVRRHVERGASGLTLRSPVVRHGLQVHQESSAVPAGTPLIEVGNPDETEIARQTSCRPMR
jgi:hypothetical protein